MLAYLTCAKLQKLVYAITVVLDFGMCMRGSEYMQHMRDTRHELALGFPHYRCGVISDTIVVGNELQLCYS